MISLSLVLLMCFFGALLERHCPASVVRTRLFVLQFRGSKYILTGIVFLTVHRNPTGA